MVDRNHVKDAVVNRLFGNKLVQNNLRSEVLEQIIALLLEPFGWRHCSGDWNSWDFMQDDGTRLEVKQSALTQTWEVNRAAVPRFDISPKSGYWKGRDWIEYEAKQRPADLFLFGWHPVEKAVADHFDPDQWEYYLVRERDLPINQNSIGLAHVKALAISASAQELAGRISQLHPVNKNLKPGII